MLVPKFSRIAAKLQKSRKFAAFPGWSSQSIRERSGAVNPGNEAINLLVYIYPLGFVSIILRLLGTKWRPSDIFIFSHVATCMLICSYDWWWIMVKAVMMSTVVEHLSAMDWVYVFSVLARHPHKHFVRLETLPSQASSCNFTAAQYLAKSGKNQSPQATKVLCQFINDVVFYVCKNLKACHL